MNAENSASNHPAPGNAGLAPRLTAGHHSPGVGEPGRSVALRFEAILARFDHAKA